MPGVIDPETMNVDDLPGIWSPVQWELTEEERNREIEEQARASLLWAVDAPETILRLLLDETGIERLFAPPDGFDTEAQGEWDESLVTFGFRRGIKLDRLTRDREYLEAVYNFGELGYWAVEVTPERVVIERV